MVMVADRLISARLRGKSVQEALSAATGAKTVVSGAGSPRMRSSSSPATSTKPKPNMTPRPAASMATKMHESRSSVRLGVGRGNELTLMHELLVTNGYRWLTDDAEFAQDAILGRERHQHPDGTMVRVDLSPYDNGPGRVGAWVMQTADRQIPGFGAQQLEHTILLQHRRSTGQ